MVNGLPIIPPSRLKDLTVAPGAADTAGPGDSRAGGDDMAPGWRGRSTRMVNAVTSVPVAAPTPIPMPMPPPAVLANRRVTCPVLALLKLTRTSARSPGASVSVLRASGTPIKPASLAI